MIFISGIHGVGKTYFCEIVKEKCHINTYIASTLISEYKKQKFSSDKMVEDIENNQRILLKAIDEKRELDRTFILDGHFCLINKNNDIQRISFDTYKELNPQAVILLLEDDKIIAERRKNRDKQLIDIDFIHEFQTSEEQYAKEVTNSLQIPLFVSKCSKDIENAIIFINNIKGEKDKCQESLIG